MLNFLFVFMALLIVGCGPQNSLESVQKIHDNYEVNVTRSIALLKREYADRYIDAYDAKDNRTLFVQVYSSGSTYECSLLQYDISRPEPRLVNKVVDLNNGYIEGIQFLPEHKLIYVRSNYKGYDILVGIYDYFTQKEIRLYNLWQSEGYDLIVAPDKRSFTKGPVSQDISDIYENY